MRIVSWNCNGALRKKFERIATLDADIYVIQECEDPATSTPAYREWAGAYLWAGNAASKGMGVFAKNGHSLEALDWPNHGLQQFLPVRIDDRLNLIAVWTKNDARMAYIGQFWQYLEHHGSLFDKGTVICGDLNSNAIWDKRGRIWNHSECVGALERRGFRSLYHLSTNERQGAETFPTLYLQRNLAKPYHIDYFFAHDDAFVSGVPEVMVGIARDWLAVSDHMPIVADIG